MSVRRSPGVLAVVLVALALGACGGSGGGSDDQPNSTDAAVTETTVAGDDGTGSTTTLDGTSAPVTSDASPVEPSVPLLGLTELTLLTEPSDDSRPLLAWEPVDGAAQYSVVVYAPSGLAYWSWRTDATSVPLGGEPRLRDDVSGPSTVSGMTWSVLAFDPDGRPIAASIESLLRP